MWLQSETDIQTEANNSSQKMLMTMMFSKCLHVGRHVIDRAGVDRKHSALRDHFVMFKRGMKACSSVDLFSCPLCSEQEVCQD
jgi:DTW domain-containing protein YfiP